MKKSLHLLHKNKYRSYTDRRSAAIATIDRSSALPPIDHSALKTLNKALESLFASTNIDKLPKLSIVVDKAQATVIDKAQATEPKLATGADKAQATAVDKAQAADR